MVNAGPPLGEGEQGALGRPLTSTEALLRFHVPPSEAQVLGRNVRVRRKFTLEEVAPVPGAAYQHVAKRKGRAAPAVAEV